MTPQSSPREQTSQLPPASRLAQELSKWSPGTWRTERRTNMADETDTFIMEGFKRIAEVNTVEDIFSRGMLSAELTNAHRMFLLLKMCVHLMTEECVMDDKTIKLVKDCAEVIKDVERR